MILGGFFIGYIANSSKLEKYFFSLKNTELKSGEFSWLWKYDSPIYDLSVNALLGSRSDFEKWRNKNKPILFEYFNKVSFPKPNNVYITVNQVHDTYTLSKIEFEIPSGFIKNNIIEGLLAAPQSESKTIPTCKPIIIAISGHEISPWGRAPYKIFEPGGWGRKFVESGFTVYAPANVFYQELINQWPKNDYYVAWTEIQRNLFYLLKNFYPLIADLQL